MNAETKRDWPAVALELVPFLGPPTLAAAIFAGSDELVFGAAAFMLASGIGWLKIGRTRYAMAVMAIRGLLLLVLLGWGLTEQINSSISANYFPDEHQATSRGTYLMIAAGAFFAVSTLASSAAVFVMSRRPAIA